MNVPLHLQKQLTRELSYLISETNGISLKDSLQLFHHSQIRKTQPQCYKIIVDFHDKLLKFHHNQIEIQELLLHPFSKSLAEFFKKFPLRYHEDHTHLTGSLSADFIHSRLQKLLDSPYKDTLNQQLKSIYGKDASHLMKKEENIAALLQLKEGQNFTDYLKTLLLPKTILIDRQTHVDCAYHIAENLYHRFNVGRVRLKFTFDRSCSSSPDHFIPMEELHSEDVVLGLYEGFYAFKQNHPDFDFILSPSFRKEPYFFDAQKFSNKKQHFRHQIQTLIHLLEKHPEIRPYVCEADTVGDEREIYRKAPFYEMQDGFKKLQFLGFRLRSHHGEIWNTLRRGIQAVDNAMNIWRIDTLEHGLSLGVNPNFYLHSILQNSLSKNQREEALSPKSLEFKEVHEMLWRGHLSIRDKLLNGKKLSDKEVTLFTKAKFHTAQEVESYQHDVLNRMLNKGISLVALPSSNRKLSEQIKDYKDHPFSWWEKKGVSLSVGTDNYVTLNTDFLQEMLILLYTDYVNLKITKLLMVCTGEKRRPYISHLMWQMRNQYKERQHRESDSSSPSPSPSPSPLSTPSSSKGDKNKRQFINKDPKKGDPK